MQNRCDSTRTASLHENTVLRGRNARECHSELVGNNALPYRTVARRDSCWSRFSQSLSDVQNHLCPCSPRPGHHASVILRQSPRPAVNKADIGNSWRHGFHLQCYLLSPYIAFSTQRYMFAFSRSCYHYPHCTRIQSAHKAMLSAIRWYWIVYTRVGIK